MNMKVYNDRKNSVIGDRRKSKQLKFRGSIFKNGLNSNNPTGLVDSDNKNYQRDQEEFPNLSLQILL